MGPAVPVRSAPRARAPSRSEDGCQVGELFRLLGEPHVLDILYIFHSDPKAHRFVELQNELKMSPNTLSDRLRGLVKCGLLTRTAYNEIPPRVEYAPTPKALELKTVFNSLSAWSERHDLRPIVVTPSEK